MEQRNPLVSCYIIPAIIAKTKTLFSDANEIVYLSLRSRKVTGARIIIGVAEIKREDLLKGQSDEMESR